MAVPTALFLPWLTTGARTKAFERMFAKRVLSAVTPRTRAVMAVHVAGLPVEIERLIEARRTWA